jgi:hypothetical protein
MPQPPTGRSAGWRFVPGGPTSASRQSLMQPSLPADTSVPPSELKDQALHPTPDGPRSSARAPSPTRLHKVHRPVLPPPVPAARPSGAKGPEHRSLREVPGRISLIVAGGVAPEAGPLPRASPRRGDPPLPGGDRRSQARPPRAGRSSPPSQDPERGPESNPRRLRLRPQASPPSGEKHQGVDKPAHRFRKHLLHPSRVPNSRFGSQSPKWRSRAFRPVWREGPGAPDPPESPESRILSRSSAARGCTTTVPVEIPTRQAPTVGSKTPTTRAPEGLLAKKSRLGRHSDQPLTPSRAPPAGAQLLAAKDRAVP